MARKARSNLLYAFCSNVASSGKRARVKSSQQRNELPHQKQHLGHEEAVGSQKQVVECGLWRLGCTTNALSGWLPAPHGAKLIILSDFSGPEHRIKNAAAS